MEESTRNEVITSGDPRNTKKKLSVAVMKKKLHFMDTSGMSGMVTNVIFWILVTFKSTSLALKVDQ